MVISAVIEGGIIKHLALDGSRLDAKSLEVSDPPQLLRLVLTVTSMVCFLVPWFW